ncbi:MAG: type II CAAX endopeptidase family protein [Lachnospiraceae bacterium]|nr:type II CAAX endopeptidase family protein [Lachnospiraceae bacterium]
MNEIQWRQKQARRVDRWHFSRIGAGLLLYHLLGAGIQLVIVNLITLSGWDYTPYAMNLNYILMLVCMYLTAFPAALAYFRTVPKFGQTRRERWGIKAWVVFVMIGLSFTYLGNLFGSFVSGFFGDSPSFESLQVMLFDGNLFLTFLTVVIGAPVVEEFLYRKLLIDRTIGYGEKLSVLLSGLLFGLMHGNFQQFFYAFLLGCLFAYIYCKTGNIRNTILFHMGINFCGGIVAPLLLKPILEVEEQLGGSGSLADAEQMLAMMLENPFLIAACLLLLLYVAFQFLSAIVGIAFFFIFRKYICFYPGIRGIPAGEAFGSAVWNLGMGAFVVFCFLQFLFLG